MLNLPGAFASLAQAVGAAVGAPFHDAVIVTQGTPTTGPGGAIVTPGSPTERACRVQIDSATEAMRQEGGYTDQDRRILVLTDGVEGDITTDETIAVASGPFAGEWMIGSVSRDPANIGFELRARRA